MSKKTKQKPVQPKTNVTEEQDKVEEAFMQAKSQELHNFLVTNGLALQPYLMSNQFGIRPSVQLVRVPPQQTNGQAQ